MKKAFVFIIFFLFIMRVDGTSTIVMDTDNKRILYSSNVHEKRSVASISKIMTCIVALENGDINKKIVIGDEITGSYGSGIYIKKGEELSLKDLLYGLMLRSGNDAAKMIATYVAGSEEEFIKLMNKKALELGMHKTTFYNASGLDNTGKGNISTAYDMALLTRYAMKNEIYKEIVKTKKHVAKSNIKTYVWHNKNKMLQYDYVTGGKTGYTEKAKRTLVSTASKDNINLVVVTIRDSDDWNTHKSLFEGVFNNYKSYLVVNKKNFSVVGDTYYDYLYVENDVRLTLKKEETKALVSHIKLEKIKNYHDGDKVGTNYIYLGNTLMGQEDIYVKKKDKESSSLIKKIKDWFK